MTALSPEQRAEAVEAAGAAILAESRHFGPLTYLTKMEDRLGQAALDAAYPIIRKAVLAEAAWAAKQWWHKPECERPDIAIRALGDEA